MSDEDKTIRHYVVIKNVKISQKIFFFSFLLYITSGIPGVSEFMSDRLRESFQTICGRQDTFINMCVRMIHKENIEIKGRECKNGTRTLENRERTKDREGKLKNIY